jgi:phosphatidylserine/phosphatidylglycerophosphate/cardiolipin synthase-like enzyme
MKNAIYTITLLLLLASCQKSKEVSKIVGKDWLLGQWENKSDEGNLLEIWKKANDSIYVGESYFIKEKDTLHSEKMELKQKGENLLYISIIKGQNKDKPVTFNHNIEIEKQLVFENSKNDYPRKIVYKRIAKDRILIEVSGIQQGKPSLTRYSMKKTD